MKKMFALAAAAAAIASVPAQAQEGPAGEGRIEARGSIGWGGGDEEFIGGVAAGYDFDLSSNAFFGPEVSYDTDFDGIDLVNLGARLGTKVGTGGKLYVGAGYDVGDADEFNASVGYQHSFSDKFYGKVEYRRYFFAGDDLNAAGVGIGVKF